MCVKIENVSLSDIKEMIESVVKSSEQVTSAKLENITSKVDATLKQATKTNGRVDKLEDDVLLFGQTVDSDSKHRLTDCPQAPVLIEINKKIRTLEDNKLTTEAQKKLVNSAITKTSIIIGIIFTIVGGIIGILTFLF